MGEMWVPAMSWTLKARVMVDDGVWEQAYSSEDGLSSPDFVRGFVCGAAWRQGIPQDLISFELEEK